jgi:plastocyanin
MRPEVVIMRKAWKTGALFMGLVFAMLAGGLAGAARAGAAAVPVPAASIGVDSTGAILAPFDQLAGNAVQIANFTFTPSPITITAGQSVTWTNTDPFAHTTTSDAGIWNSGPLAPGASFTQTFGTAGTFTYHCMIHPFMMGSVIVQPAAPPPPPPPTPQTVIVPITSFWPSIGTWMNGTPFTFPTSGRVVQPLRPPR